jgi:hypothetical protein
MSYNNDLLNFVDDLIAQHRPDEAKMGTIADHPDGTDIVFVVFDGSSLAVPVRTFANVRPRGGDRVGVLKFGADWVVVGVYGPAWPSQADTQQLNGTGSTTSASFVDMPGPKEFAFTKEYDYTRIRLAGAFMAYSSGADANAAFGLRLIGTGTSNGTFDQDYTIALFRYATASVRLPTSGFKRIISVPVGPYTIRARWKRTGGTGTLQADPSPDAISIEAAEIGPGTGATS